MTRVLGASLAAALAVIVVSGLTGCGGGGAGAGVANGVWSPDGNKVLFVSSRDASREIYVINADGSNLVRLTNNAAEDRYPCWSPDGTKIAFASTRVGSVWHLFVMNADGTGVTQLGTAEGTDISWSPDGTRIAYFDGDNIWTVSAVDGSGAVQITNTEGNDISPVWSPDGTQIAFASARTGTMGIYVALADGTGARRVTSATQAATDPEWSRDGTHIFYLDSGGNVYVVAADGTGATQVLMGRYYEFRFSPSGDKVAYWTWVGDPDNADVFVARADGTRADNLTGGVARNWLQ